jgi:hypothetical protein
MLLGKKWKDMDADERELILRLRRKIRSTPRGKRLGKLAMRKRLQKELMAVGDAELHAAHLLTDLEHSSTEDREAIKQNLRRYRHLVGPAVQRAIDRVAGGSSTGWDAY